MNRVTDVLLKISKVVVFALFSIQYIYAIWWVINNIGVVPDFSIPSESFLYNQITLIIGKGFFVLYLLQAIALYFGIRALVPNNQWVARFAITNPLLLQFIFSLTPDVFAVSVVLALLGDLIRREKIKSKHAFFLVLLGILHSRYFLIGLLIIVMIVIVQCFLVKKSSEELSGKQKVSNALAFIQIILVVVLVVLSYQTQENMDDQVLVQEEFIHRFTVNEIVPSQHSAASIAKGFVEDSLFYALSPVTSVRVIDDLRLTQNSWNYVNFTREVPVWSRAFIELSERNMIIAIVFFVFSVIMYLIFVQNKEKTKTYDILLLLATIAICIVIAITSRRGVDYRNAIVLIPIYYTIILSFYEKIHLWEKKEDRLES